MLCPSRISLLLPVVALLASASSTLVAQVVINEIFYHAPDDLERLEYVELFNHGTEAVDLSGWKLTKGVQYTFPDPSIIPEGGFVVICKDADLFAQIYEGIAVSGEFAKALSNRSDKINLKNADGKTVDSVEYHDRSPWPVSPDGYSASLERLSPEGPGDAAANWAPSSLSDRKRQPAGTPGAVNSVYTEAPGPVITAMTVGASVIAPNHTLTVTAEVSEGTPDMTLLYRIASPGEESSETAVSMARQIDGRYEAKVPGQAANRIIRLRVKATSKSGASRIFPHPHEIRPALSVYVDGGFEPAKIPVVQFFNVGAQEHAEGEAYRTRHSERGGRGFGRPRFGPDRGGRQPFGQGVDRGRERPRGDFRRPRWGREEAPPKPIRPQGRSAFIYTDLESKRPRLFDFVNIVERKSGYKVRLHKDQPLHGMTTLNVLFERDEGTTINETLAYDLYRLAGNATPASGFFRVLIDGKVAGYHLWFEQLNGAFFRRHEIDDEGNLYKLIWMGNHRPSKYIPADQQPRRMDIVGRHEKKTHPHEGYGDLVSLIEALEDASGSDEPLAALIEQHFDVDQVVTYFAVNALLSHWDGFFNNYFLYHDVEGTGKWSLFPWDQDSTWSMRMGMPEDLSIMPLNFGAEGARPPEADAVEVDRGGRDGRRFRGFGGRRRGPGWWRDGGDISRPLLAHPAFFQRYRERLQTLLETAFNEHTFGPKIDALIETLGPEVRLRATTFDRDPDQAMDALRATVSRLREHLRLRSAFLHRELGE